MLFLIFAASAADPLPEVTEVRIAYRAALVKEKEAITEVTTNDLKSRCAEAAQGYRDAKAKKKELDEEIARIGQSKLDQKTITSLIAPLKIASEKATAELLDRTRQASATGEEIPRRAASARSAAERAAWIDTEIARLDKLEGKRPLIDRHDTTARGLGPIGPEPATRLEITMLYEDYIELPDEFSGCSTAFGSSSVTSAK